MSTGSWPTGTPGRSVREAVREAATVGRRQDGGRQAARQAVGQAARQAVGTAVAGRVHMHGPGYPRYWLGIWVMPGARRVGVGSALLDVLSDAARAAGKTGFATMLSEEHAEGHRFLGARGFVEFDRMRQVRLDLRGIEAPPAVAPPGIAIVTLAERPDLVAAVHGVAVATFPTIPTGAEPLEAGTLR